MTSPFFFFTVKCAGKVEGKVCGVRYLSGKTFLASEKGPEDRVRACVRCVTMSFSRMMIVRLCICVFLSFKYTGQKPKAPGCYTSRT